MPAPLSARDEILGRIREALRHPAPRPHDASEIPGDDEDHDPHFREWLPPAGRDYRAWRALFAKQSEVLRTRFIPVGQRDAPKAFADLAREEGWQTVAYQPHAFIDPLVAGSPSQSRRIEPGYDPVELEACDAGVTACDCLVAQTGSVCLTSRSANGRVLSVLPPHHVVVAHRDQLLPDLTAAYAFLRQKYGAAYPSFIGFVTGPSRTGDIERILVLGAHGPKKLTVLLLE